MQAAYGILPGASRPLPAWHMWALVTACVTGAMLGQHRHMQGSGTMGLLCALGHAMVRQPASNWQCKVCSPVSSTGAEAQAAQLGVTPLALGPRPTTGAEMMKGLCKEMMMGVCKERAALQRLPTCNKSLNPALRSHSPHNLGSLHMQKGDARSCSHSRRSCPEHGFHMGKHRPPPT